MEARKIILFLFLPLIIINVKAQVNNVLNYSFEQQIGCGGIGNCSGTGVFNWYEPTLSSANWFSSCNGEVPQNYAGYQYARTGIAYSLVGLAEKGLRSYITGTFSDSLIATKKYCVTFYVSLADSMWWAMSAIGAYISSDSMACNPNSDTVLHYNPQIENPSSNVLTNKIDWVPVSGEYIAIGGEKFITIGDFYSDASSDIDSVGHGGFVAGWNTAVQTYYYVDDVYVRELTIANAGKTDTICAGDKVQIGKDTTTAGVSFYWLPATGLNNPNIAQPWATPSVTTTYTLMVVNDSVLAINNRGQACNCADSVTKDSVKIVVNTCIGIDELIDKNISFNLYPNPNNGNFTLVYDLGNETTGKFEIYNNISMEIGEYLLNSCCGTIQISNENLRQGLYFYKVFTDSGIKKVGKIVIIK